MTVTAPATDERAELATRIESLSDQMDRLSRHEKMTATQERNSPSWPKEAEWCAPG